MTKTSVIRGESHTNTGMLLLLDLSTSHQHSIKPCKVNIGMLSSTVQSGPYYPMGRCQGPQAFRLVKGVTCIALEIFSLAIIKTINHIFAITENILILVEIITLIVLVRFCLRLIRQNFEQLTF